MWINFKERMPDKSTHVRMAGKDEWEWFDKPVESPQSTTPQPLDGKEESADFGAFMNTKRSDLSGNFKKDFKSQPSQLGEGKPFSEAIKDPSFHQKYWEDPPLPEQGKEDKIKADILREYQNDIFNSEHLLTKQMCYDAMEAYADQQVKAALKSKPTDGWSDELVRLYGEYSFRFSGFPSERENPEQWLSSYRKTKQ